MIHFPCAGCHEILHAISRTPAHQCFIWNFFRPREESHDSRRRGSESSRARARSIRRSTASGGYFWGSERCSGSVAVSSSAEATQFVENDSPVVAKLRPEL